MKDILKDFVYGRINLDTMLDRMSAKMEEICQKEIDRIMEKKKKNE